MRLGALRAEFSALDNLERDPYRHANAEAIATHPADRCRNRCWERRVEPQHTVPRRANRIRLIGLFDSAPSRDRPSIFISTNSRLAPTCRGVIGSWVRAGASEREPAACESDPAVAEERGGGSRRVCPRWESRPTAS